MITEVVIITALIVDNHNVINANIPPLITLFLKLTLGIPPKDYRLENPSSFSTTNLQDEPIIDYTFGVTLIFLITLSSKFLKALSCVTKMTPNVQA